LSKAKERLKQEKQKKKKIVFVCVLVAVVVLIIVVGVVLINTMQAKNGTVYNESPVDDTGQNVKVPLSDISGTNFHFYSYDSGGTAIKYFIVKDSSGNIHTAFDACNMCYEAKKGYEQSVDSARCRNCGKTFSVSDIGTKNTAGGCWPGYLPHTLGGDSIVIKTTDLDTGKYMFQ
jgi:uncharacterized membrane protein